MMSIYAHYEHYAYYRFNTYPAAAARTIELNVSQDDICACSASDVDFGVLAPVEAGVVAELTRPVGLADFVPLLPELAPAFAEPDEAAPLFVVDPPVDVPVVVDATK